MLLRKKAKEVFGIEPVNYDRTLSWMDQCVEIYKGNPCWINEEEHIDTIVFAKAICSEVARLATLGIGIHVDGSSRAEWLQQQIEKVYFQLRHWLEYACACGTVILKPGSNGIDLYMPGEFEITHSTDGKVDGVIFHNWQKEDKKWYTLLEYHRYEGDAYHITNKCFAGNAPDDTKKAVDIQESPWAGMQEEAVLGNIKMPLFGVLKMPGANNIDIGSPCGLPVFSEAVQELRDLDIAYFRNAKEIFDSKRTVLLDSDTMMTPGKKLSGNLFAGLANTRSLLGLPDVVKNVQGDGREMFYQEINPEMNTDVRLKGINALLSQIGYKVGFSNGYFVFNESSGIQTATGVEAEQQRTIQFIKDVRDRLEDCLQSVISGLNSIAELYNLAPAGAYEVVFDFGDITYDREHDRARWWGYVTSGKVPAWMFFVKFEGMTEEDAKAMVAEASPKQPSLFGNEE